MRAIKFRGWNGKEMLNDVFKVTKNPAQLYQGAPISAQCVFSWSMSSVQDVMQFTGLLDKNGVEIYEGDIVLLNDHFASAVEFYGCGFVVKTKSIYANRGIDVNPPSEYETVEVIGNIHENPELLK